MEENKGLMGLIRGFFAAMKEKGLPFSERLKKGLGKYYDFVLYCIVGGLTTVINLAVYYAAVNIFDLDPVRIANPIAWIVAMLFAFFANKLWVFDDKSWEPKHALYQFCTFAAARVLSLGLEELFLYIGIDLLHMNDNIVKIPVQIIVVLVNYVASKLITFRKTK